MSLQHASLTLSPSQSLPTEVAQTGEMFVSSAPLQLSPTIVVIPTALLSLTLTSVTAAATAITNSSDSDSRPGAENGECRLLGPFALFIQGALGALALLSLVYKRWRERPQRPVKIWAFDASKQVVGSSLLHIANLFLSMVSSGQFTVKADDYQANPCSFYLLNLAIDTTIGIPILIVLLRLLHHGFSLTPLADPPESIQSGHYGHPPRASWWLKQSFIYFLGLLGMKFCVFLIFQLCPWIITVGDWALRWTEGNEMVQVFFVMLFFPVIMNAIQYYIIDSFIKNQKPTDHEAIPTEDSDEDYDENPRRSRRGRSREEGGSDDSEDEDIIKSRESVKAAEVSDKGRSPDRTNKLKANPKKLDEYDPATDGDGDGGSGSSARSRRGSTSPAKDGDGAGKRI